MPIELHIAGLCICREDENIIGIERERRYMIVFYLLSQTSPLPVDGSDQPDGSSTKKSESDGDSEDDEPLSKLSKV